MRKRLTKIQFWQKNSWFPLIYYLTVLNESLHTLLLLDFSVLLLLKQTYNSERDSLHRVYKKNMDIKDTKNRLKRCCEIQMWAPSCGAHFPKNKLCFLHRSDNIFWVTLFVSLILGKFSVLELICKIFSEFEKIKKSFANECRLVSAPYISTPIYFTAAVAIKTVTVVRMWKQKIGCP